MDLLAAERGGAVAEDSQITQDAWQDIHVAWDLCKLKDVQGSTSVVANLKTQVSDVKKSARSALLLGVLPATNALSNHTIWSKSTLNRKFITSLFRIFSLLDARHRYTADFQLA